MVNDHHTGFVQPRSSGLSRRRALKAGACVAGAAWVAPVIHAIPLVSSAAEAASGNHQPPSRSDSPPDSSRDVTNPDVERPSPVKPDNHREVDRQFGQSHGSAASASSQSAPSAGAGGPGEDSAAAGNRSTPARPGVATPATQIDYVG